MARDEESLSDYAERVAALLYGAGFPRMPARILMTLMVNETGLTAAELAERLDASAAAISGAVRYLQTLAMIHRVSQNGSRRDVYEINNAWYLTSLSNNRIYDAMLSMSENVVSLAGGTQSQAGARLEEMVEFYRFLRRRMPQLLVEWEELRRGADTADQKIG